MDRIRTRLVQARSEPLNDTAFRRLFLGQSISAFGDRLVPVALAFAVLDLTGSVADLGIVFAAQAIPLTIFVLLGGVWADRLKRQLVMLASDGVRAVAQAATAALLISGSARVWEIAALQAVYGTAEAFFSPAATALVPQLVDRHLLQRANALLALSGNVAAVLGPAVAGVIVAAMGPGVGLAVDAATFVVSAAFLRSITTTPLPLRPPSGTIAELRQGWRAFRSRQWLCVTVGYCTLLVAFTFGPLQVLGPEVARRSLGGPGAWAAISVALGLGALIGGAIGLRWRPRHPLRAGFCGFLAAGPALFALLAAHAALPLIMAAALCEGIAGTAFNVLWQTSLQREVPAGELSRVSSWDYLGSLTLQPIGLALSGPIALALGVSTTLYAAGALLLLLVAAALSAHSVRDFTHSQSSQTGRQATEALRARAAVAHR